MSVQEFRQLPAAFRGPGLPDGSLFGAIFALAASSAFGQFAVPKAAPMPAPEIQYLAANGQPLAGAKLCTYAAGTNTPQSTYTDSTAGTPNANPVVLDASGRASVWIGPQLYKFVLRTGGDATCSTGAVLWTQDNVSDTSLYLANFVKTEWFSVQDFGAVADNATDAGPAFNAALAAAIAVGGKSVIVPDGNYYIATTVVDKGPVTLRFGSGTVRLKKNFILAGNYAAIECHGTTLQADPAIAYADNDLILAAFGGVYPNPTSAIQGISINGCTVDGNLAATSVGRPYPNDTHGNGINLNRCQDCKVLNNHVKNVVYQAIADTGDFHDDGNDPEIASNVVEYMGEIAIGVENHVRHSRIHHNLIRYGLNLAENRNTGPNAAILVGCGGCTVTRPLADGHIIDHNVIENFIPSGNTLGSRAIAIINLADRTVVSGNIMDRVGNCIDTTLDDLSQGASSLNPANYVVVNGNTCSNTAHPGHAGLFIPVTPLSAPRGSIGWSITGNTFYNTAAEAIHIDNAADFTIESNVAVNPTGAGIYLSGDAVVTSQRIALLGNRVLHATGQGITIANANVFDSEILGDILLNNAGGPYNDKGTRTRIGGLIADSSDDSFHVRSLASLAGPTVYLPSGTSVDNPGQLGVNSTASFLSILGGNDAQSGKIILCGSSWSGGVNACSNDGGVGLWMDKAAGSDVRVGTFDGTAHVPQWQFLESGLLSSSGLAFAKLGTPAGGAMVYCSDCTVTNPCAGGGSGAFAKRLGSTWVCN